MSQVDTNGNPFPNADDYIDYKSFGCLYPVSAYDIDDDGLVNATISLPPGADVPDLVVTLTCDSCALTPNPHQSDQDCDERRRCL